MKFPDHQAGNDASSEPHIIGFTRRLAIIMSATPSQNLGSVFGNAALISPL